MSSENGETLAGPTDEISHDWVQKQTLNFSQYVTPDAPPGLSPSNGNTSNYPVETLVNMIFLYLHSYLNSLCLQELPFSFKSATDYIDAYIRAERTYSSDVDASVRN